VKLQVFETALSSNHAFCHTIDDATGPAEAAGILVGDIITAARIFSFLGETFPLEDIIGFRAWSLEASMRVIQYHAFSPFSGVCGRVHGQDACDSIAHAFSPFSGVCGRVHGQHACDSIECILGVSVDAVMNSQH
jgi:hypothetical protein